MRLLRKLLAILLFCGGLFFVAGLVFARPENAVAAMIMAIVAVSMLLAVPMVWPRVHLDLANDHRLRR